MRIKQLEIIGFKSFSQKTVLDFPRGITAIVGPNGCGKSNVVDAIRWVLGEQSPKHLRGESMEDVVFKGNDRAAPSGMAQVSLTFENDPDARHLTDLDLDISTVPAHVRDSAEIQVTRRYFRSGESEYFINKTACRLKDITELFLGTGVGAKAYAIIEQGRVEQLINAKPEDRRLFIEEAAGTTLYRSRKLAAERKMERTRENLLRVNDVLRELDRQIQYLHRLAKKAEQYRSLQSEIRRLDLALAGVQSQRLTTAVAGAVAELAAAREKEAELVAALDRLDAERAGQVAAHAALEETLARRREAAAAIESEAQGLEARLALLRDEVRERERRGNRLDGEAVAHAEQQAQLRAATELHEQERAEYAQLMLVDERALAAREAELAEARRLVSERQEAVEAAKNAVVGVASREAECRNAIATHTRRRDDAQRRLEKLNAEHVEVSERLAVVEAAIRSRQGDIQQLREQLRTAEGEKEQRAERVRTLAESRRRCDRELSETRDAVLQLRTRLASFQDIQRNYEGYQRGVRAILRDVRPQNGVMGVVGDVLEVPAQYERALAAALGERLQYVIVQQEDDGIGAVATLRDHDSGRGSFIPLSPRKIDLNGHGAHALNGGTRRLLDLVRVDEPYRQVAETLLGEVVMVPDLQSGLELWRQNGVHVTMVTPDGDTIDATGVITGGSEHVVEEDIVSRRRVVAELGVQVESLERRLQSEEAEINQLGAELESEETALKNLDRDVHALTLALVAAEKDIERLEGERPRWGDRLEVLHFERASATAEATDDAAAVRQREGELVDLMAHRQSLDLELRACQARGAEAIECGETLGADVTAIKVRLAERRERHEALVTTLARLRGQLEELAKRGAALHTEREETARERLQLQGATEEAVTRRTALLSERDAVETEMATVRTQLASSGEAVAAHEQLMQVHRADLDRIRAAAGHLEVTLAQTRLRIEHLTESLREKYGNELDLENLLPDLGGEEEEQVLARLEGLREKVVRIGEVSVGAIDELRELEERAQFLRLQKEDLERSLDDLEKTIHRLNRASRTKFAETFKAANDKFQQILPQLFRGGEARLVLTDEHNLLETGVEIVVRPPGKKLETVTLLSGGEKALVAVSLIFSLFLINPTPFCFLDEVDAPLDDANIGRFTNLVREMSHHSQFIVITHNKRTMQAADVLYGVTMEEPGISKLISVAMH